MNAHFMLYIVIFGLFEHACMYLQALQLHCLIMHTAKHIFAVLPALHNHRNHLIIWNYQMLRYVGIYCAEFIIILVIVFRHV